MAQETKFTPGPWSCFYKHKYDEWHVSMPVAGSSMRAGLCDDGIESPNREADAHLIAAAPDMYEALEAAEELHQTGLIAASNELIERVATSRRAALSKARGES